MGANGRVGLTVAGQVIGSYFGPIGAAIGGMIGSYIGGELWPEQLEGPKLDGVQVTSSAYGQAIPSVYGGIRLGGNIIWSSEIRETARTERSGKGGGPEVTQYSYSLDFAVALCEGPITAIRRIWTDQRLIYDLGDGENVATIRASGLSDVADARFYLGTEDQLPDPTIEAALGVGLAPAYRGTCYIVFEDFQLENYGNRVPNVTVELVANAEIADPQLLFATLWSESNDDRRIIHAARELVGLSETTAFAYVSELDGTDVKFSPKTPFETWPANGVTFDAPLFLSPETLFFFPGGTDSPAIYSRLGTGNTLSSTALPNYQRLQASGYNALEEFGLYGADFTSLLSNGGDYIHAACPCSDRLHVFVVCQPYLDTGADFYWTIWRWDALSASFEEVDTGPVEDNVRRFGGDMRSIDQGQSMSECGMMESDLRHIWSNGTNAGAFLHRIDDDGVLRQVATIPYTYVISPTILPRLSIYADGGLCWVYRTSEPVNAVPEPWLYGFTRLPLVSDPTQPLSEVVSDICVRSGLDESDFDVTALAGIDVRGYLRTPRMSGRAAIEPLMTAYAFDAVESDGQIKFVLRTADSVATFDADDLGAGQEGATMLALVETERAQESELPAQLDVSYMAAGADYQIGSQIVKRSVTSSVDAQSLRLAMAFDDDEAANICARMLYEIWIGRNTRKWATTIKYSKYEPTDVVDLESDSAIYRVRITDKREAGNLIAWSGIDVDAAAFDALSTAEDVPGHNPIRLPSGITQLVAADLPPLRDADYSTFGYYVATAGFSTPWPGATVFESLDGLEYDSVVTITEGAVMGGAVTALGGWGAVVEGGYTYLGYFVDELSYVDVAMTSGVPESCTFDELLALTNVALLGNEIVAFRTVESLGDNLYRLTGFLRGIGGTEYYASLPPATYDNYYEIINGVPYTRDPSQVDGHRAGDRFVLLNDETVRRLGGDTTLLAAGNIYNKAVSAGGSLATVGATRTPIWGVSMVPPHPIETFGYKNAAGDLVIECTPRVYVGGDWVDGRDTVADPSADLFLVYFQVNGTARNKSVAIASAPPLIVSSLDLGSVTDDGIITSVAFWVSPLPWQYPSLGGSALVSVPPIRPRFWSRRNFVLWT